MMRGIEGKVVVLGSRGVGKTHLVTKYINNAMHTDNGPTIPASLFTCRVMLEDVRVKMQIWDTAGQERFKAVAPMYYRNANAAILVFDLTQHKTFTEIKSWIKELHRIVQDPMILTLVGNKLDLQSKRTVTHNEAFLFATSIGASYFEVSAETNQGLEQVFLFIASGLIRLAKEGKARSLRQFDSCDSIAAYTNNNATAFSHLSATIANGNGAFHLAATGIPVNDDSVKTTAEGRLETPSRYNAIDHIAWGEVEPVGWCC